MITFDSKHGQYATDAYSLDEAIRRYLPASVNDLQTIMAEREPELDYSDIHSVSEFLIMLASFEYDAAQNRRAIDIPPCPSTHPGYPGLTCSFLLSHAGDHFALGNRWPNA